MTRRYNSKTKRWEEKGLTREAPPPLPEPPRPPITPLPEPPKPDYDPLWDGRINKPRAAPPPLPEPPRPSPTPTPKTDPVHKEKYNQSAILNEIGQYIKNTDDEHYNNIDEIECFDVWNSLGDSSSTYRNNAIKYLWRYGKKNGTDKTDLLKAIHVIMMMINEDHYNR